MDPQHTSSCLTSHDQCARHVQRNAGAGDSTVNIDTSRLDSLVLSKEYSSPISAVSMDLKQVSARPPARSSLFFFLTVNQTCSSSSTPPTSLARLT